LIVSETALTSQESEVKESSKGGYLFVKAARKSRKNRLNGFFTKS